MVRIIGLTGPIACGKSSVTRCLEECGCPVIDADKVAHEVIGEKEGPVQKALVAAFGDGIIGKDGCVDRKLLGPIVLNDPVKLKKLNSITHGPILRRMMKQAAKCLAKGYRRMALDIPLLVKFPFSRKVCMSTVLVVVTSPETQMARLRARDNLSEEEAMVKIRAQVPPERLLEIAGHVISNDGTEEELRRSVKNFIDAQPSGWSIYEMGLLSLGVLAAGLCGWSRL